ncbi:Ankyrin repeat protein 1 [Giardia muris]|uniref:Ankyrin repeat protein 1 n=1 Tax=Giardia muris TaxID=5742 RepID=A0A4Z1SPH5_GIAMU|nr:Ankyrin repeat protein 1 [Giardia muris]|eukprot:TNJ27722.1 Ankyrin repeat protein 1 [Giardia muris]
MLSVDDWFEAVRARNYAAVAENVEKFACSANAEGRTALMEAVEMRDLELVRILADAESLCADGDGNSALMIAAEHDAVECVAELLNYSDRAEGDVKPTPFMIAAVACSNMALRLLSYYYGPETDADGRNALDYAVSASNQEGLEIILHQTTFSLDDVRDAADRARTDSNDEMAIVLDEIQLTLPSRTLRLAGLEASDDTSTTIVKLKHEIDDLTAQLNKAQIQLLAVESASHTDLNEAIQARDQEIEDLRKVLEDLQRANSEPKVEADPEAETDITRDLRAEIEVLSSRVRELEEQNAELTSTIEVEREYSAAEAERARLLAEENEGLKADLHAATTAADAKVAELQAEITAHEALSAQLADRRDALADEVKLLKERLSEDVGVSRLADPVDTSGINHALDDAKADYQAKCEEVLSIKEELTELRGELEMARRDLEIAQEQLRQREEKAESVKEVPKPDPFQAIADIELQIEARAPRGGTSGRTLEEAETELSDMRDYNERIEAQVRVLESKITRLVTANEELERKYSETKIALAVAEQDVSELRERLRHAERQTQLGSRAPGGVTNGGTTAANEFDAFLGEVEAKIDEVAPPPLFPEPPEVGKDPDVYTDNDRSENASPAAIPRVDAPNEEMRELKRAVTDLQRENAELRMTADLLQESLTQNAKAVLRSQSRRSLVKSGLIDAAVQERSKSKGRSRGGREKTETERLERRERHLKRSIAQKEGELEALELEVRDSQLRNTELKRQRAQLDAVLARLSNVRSSNLKGRRSHRPNLQPNPDARSTSRPAFVQEPDEDRQTAVIRTLAEANRRLSVHIDGLAEENAALKSELNAAVDEVIKSRSQGRTKSIGRSSRRSEVRSEGRSDAGSSTNDALSDLPELPAAVPPISSAKPPMPAALRSGSSAKRPEPESPVRPANQIFGEFGLSGEQLSALQAARIETYTPLMRAVMKGKTADVESNLQYAGEVSIDGRTALMMAAEYNRVSAVPLLIPKEAGIRDDNGLMAVHVALHRGHYEVAELLRKTEGLKVEPIERANGHKTQLMQAAEEDDVYTVWSLIPTQGALQDADGITALMLAAGAGHKQIVALLIGGEARMQTAWGTTALMWACQFGHIDCVRMLIPKEVKIRDKRGRSALYYARDAAKHDSAERKRLIEALLKQHIAM